MAKADIWMPLFIGDYLADTTRLTTEQHGAYLLLMMDYWRSGPPPDNDAILAQITRLSPDAWSIAKAVLAPYFSIEQGYWRHNRIDRELADAKTSSEKAKARATAGAAARWGKKDAVDNDAASNASSISQAKPEQCPSPSPSHTQPTVEKRHSRAKPVDDFVLPDWLPADAWKGFVDMRAKKKKDMTPRARDLILKTLKSLLDGGHDVAAILDRSTVNNWTDVYAPKLEERRTEVRPYQSRQDKARAWADRVTGNHRNDNANPEIIDLN